MSEIVGRDHPTWAICQKEVAEEPGVDFQTTSTARRPWRGGFLTTMRNLYSLLTRCCILIAEVWLNFDKSHQWFPCKRIE